MPGFTDAITVPGAVPVAGVTDSQSAPDVTVALNGRFAPVPVTEIDCDAGLLLPAT